MKSYFFIHRISIFLSISVICRLSNENSFKKNREQKLGSTFRNSDLIVYNVYQIGENNKFPSKFIPTLRFPKILVSFEKPIYHF